MSYMVVGLCSGSSTWQYPWIVRAVQVLVVFFCNAVAECRLWWLEISDWYWVAYL